MHMHSRRDNLICMWVSLILYLVLGGMAAYHMGYEVEGIDQAGATFVYGFFAGIFFTLFALSLNRLEELKMGRKQG